jgi:hypothetical protein
MLVPHFKLNCQGAEASPGVNGPDVEFNRFSATTDVFFGDRVGDEGADAVAVVMVGASVEAAAALVGDLEGDRDRERARAGDLGTATSAASTPEASPSASSPFLSDPLKRFLAGSSDVSFFSFFSAASEGFFASFTLSLTFSSPALVNAFPTGLS